jgi:hypothetical protein
MTLIIQTLCTSFKRELLQGVHNLSNPGGDTFKVALYTSSATLDASTTVYTTANEVPATGGYTTGGNTLVTITPASSDGVAFAGFENTSWAASTITAAGALIYNSSKANKAVAVLSFGGNESSIAQSFNLIFPPTNSQTAIIQID